MRVRVVVGLCLVCAAGAGAWWYARPGGWRVSPRTYVLAEGVQLRVRQGQVSVYYANGQEYPADGVGIAVVALADYRANPDRLRGVPVQDADFPVLVFFNESGFDATGQARVVRRAADGARLWADRARPAPAGRLAALVPRASGGGYTGYLWDSADPVVINDEDFATAYMGLLDEQPRSGVRGRVIKVGGRQKAVEPVAGVTVLALEGKAEPTQTAAAARKKYKVAGEAPTRADGGFALPLKPGTYTLLVEEGDKLFGNAADTDVWPPVTVRDGWVDYEFRRGN